MKHTPIILAGGSGSTPEDPEIRALPFKKKVTAIVILLLALISGAMTFEGAYLLNLRVGGQSFATVVMAALIAIGVTAGIMTAWWVMMSVIPTLGSAKRVAAGLALVLALQGWMLAVSTTNNVIALGAPDALVSHMERTQSFYEKAVSAAMDRALAIKPYLGSLQGEAEGRCVQAEGERDRGSMSRAPGPGAISGMLDMLCTQSSAIVDTLRATVSTTEMRATEADDLLRRLDSVIWDHDKSVFAREREFLALLGKLKAWLRLTASEDLTKALETSHAVMAAGVTPPSLADGQFGALQQQLIGNLRASVEDTGAVYQRIARELAAKPLPSLPDSARISLPRAVWMSRLDLTPQIAAAVGIDFFQIFMVLAFLVGRPKSAR